MENTENKKEQNVQNVTLPEGKCCTLYCGDCTYFNPRKTSFGKCWCGYFKAYSRNSDDLACSHFCR